MVGNKFSAEGVSPKWVKSRRRRRKKKVGENNGQLRFVRHHVWRTQARLDQKMIFGPFLLLFTASFWSPPPGPPLVSGVLCSIDFLSSNYSYLHLYKVWKHKKTTTTKLFTDSSLTFFFSSVNISNRYLKKIALKRDTEAC